MTPDARLLAAATIFAHGTSGMTPQKAAEYVAQLEAVLTPNSDKALAGLVPVGWVTQMLAEIQDASPPPSSDIRHAGVHDCPHPVCVKINAARAQLAQFSEPV